MHEKYSDAKLDVWEEIRCHFFGWKPL